MSVTLTASLQAALASPTAEPRTLLDLETAEGVYHFATETLSWSGITYVPRLETVGDITLSIGDPGQRVVGAKSVSLTLGNADGWCSRRRPEFFRGRTLTLKQVFLDVNSDALRTYTFRCTGGQMLDAARYQLTFEDALSTVGRNLVPSAAAIITRDNFPNITDNAPGLGRPVPLLYGHAYVPLYLVDDTTADAVFVACVGSAVAGSSGAAIMQAFATEDGPLSFVSTLDIRYQTIGGVPLTTVHLNTDSFGIYNANAQPLAHYADLMVNSDVANPADVLVDLLTNSWVGAGLKATDVDSASVAGANAWTLAESSGFAPRFACVLTDQRAMQDWLNAWTFEALTTVVVRDRIYLVPEAASRTAQASLTPATILQATLRSQDTDMNAVPTTRTVAYRDRTRDIGSASFQTWTAQGCGPDQTDAAVFVGTPSDAFRVAQFWAGYGAAGIRTYTADTTLRLAFLDPADLVTLTHTQVAAAAMQTELASTTIQGRTVSLGLRELPSAVFSLQGALPTDPIFQRLVQNVPYNAGSWFLLNGTTFTFTSSHALGTVPTAVLTYGTTFLATSWVSANGSEFTITHKAYADIQVSQGQFYQLRADPQ